MANEVLRLGTTQTIRVVGETPEELEVEATWKGATEPAPLHLHPAQDELFEVRSGTLAAVVAGEKRSLSPGDRLEIPAGTPHQMWNEADEPAVASWRTRPAGRTAEWFRLINRFQTGGTQGGPLPDLATALREYADVFQLVTEAPQ